jgi:hypothetical protein
MWDIYLDPGSLSADAVPIRGASFKANIVNFLQPPKSPTNLIHIQVDPYGTNFPAGKVACFITLQHPFPGTMFCGFDVQGIVIGEHASYLWESDPTIISSLPPFTILQNPDGWTRWWNQPEFTTYGKLFGYIEGSLAHHGWDSTHTLNAYKVYADEFDEYMPFNPDPTRRTFFSSASPGQNTRRYELQFPGAGGVTFHFKYAVSACWAAPSPDSTAPYEPYDFPVTANQPEPYKIDFVNDGSTAYFENGADYGGDIRGFIRVCDWQFTGDLGTVKDEISAVTIESPTLFNGVISLDLDNCAYDYDDPLAILIPFEVNNVTPTDLHNQLLLVTAYSANPTTYEPQIPGISGFDYPDAPLASYDLLEIPVKSSKSGWALTWGGIGTDSAIRAPVDGSDCIYVPGTFQDTVDFDPGSGVEEHVSNGSADLFLSKFDASGALQWVRTWGGTDTEMGGDILIDALGGIYFVGTFSKTVDFDPGGGVDNRTSNGSRDVFLSKFDSSGNFQWVRTWGGSNWDSGGVISADLSGDIYISGIFSGTVDFDPGGGTDIHEPNGAYDVFLSKFDSSGNFLWARTWGGNDIDESSGISIDASGVYVTGWFRSFSVDFDPGDGEDIHKPTTGSYFDVFLTKFDFSGAFLWARTWGGGHDDRGQAVSVDGLGNVYVTGSFKQTADFDPGDGVVEYSSNGQSDAFLSRFNSSGDFQGVRVWGGSNDDESDGILIDGTSNMYVTGGFRNTIDFDPGPGTCYRASNGSVDAFLSKFDSIGNFLWAVTWGGAWIDGCYSPSVDNSDNILVTGRFAVIADFDPGSGVDNRKSKGSYDAFLTRFFPDGRW